MRISDWSSDVCSSDLQPRKRVGKPGTQVGGRRMEVAGELGIGVVRGEHPPLVARAALVADRGPAALDSAVVRADATPGLDPRKVPEGEPAQDVQVVLPLRPVTPPRTPRQRGADAE